MSRRAILHFDGDSFFASVEQVLDYTLKGKPIITGGERGAITSASIEAKRLGINRGLSFKEAKELCPTLIVVPGNYLQYSIFAERMYAIVREFTDQVEEYSIDECFADITGLDRVYKKSYEEIALSIKEKLEKSLGVTFGVGLAPNKVLAKVASKHRKPGGFTVITLENRREFLETLPAGKVWGIGPALSADLLKRGVRTALEFADKSEAWIESEASSKPYRELQLELQGHCIKKLQLEADQPKSIIKSHTFRPPSASKVFLLTQLSYNLEAACSKARRYKLRPKEIRFYLKTQTFTYQSYSITLPLASASPGEIMKWVNLFLDQVHKPRTLYRATGVCLKNFTQDFSRPDLFGESEKIEKQAEVYKAVDKISRRFGDGSIYLASSHRRDHALLNPPSKSLDIPFLGVVR